MISHGIDKLEIYLLNTVLVWRLTYTTPYDIVQFITKKIAGAISASADYFNSIVSCANILNEMLFLCTFFHIDHLAINESASKSPYALAIATLVGAATIQGKKEFAEQVQRFIRPEDTVFFNQ